MEKKVVKCEINKNLSAFIAKNIIEGLEKFPYEDASSVMNGIAVALLHFAGEISKNATEEGMVEKMVLSWFDSCDKVKGTQFGKYIHLDDETEEG